MQEFELNIRKGPDGQYLYFPNGPWTLGYVLPTLDAAIALRRSFRTFNTVVMIITTATAATLKLYALGLIPVLILLRYIATRLLTRGLSRSSERIPFRQAWDNSSRKLPWPLVVFGLVGSALFVVLGVFLIDKGDKLLALASTSFFGLCFVLYICVAFKKLIGVKNDEHHPNRGA